MLQLFQPVQQPTKYHFSNILISATKAPFKPNVKSNEGLCDSNSVTTRKWHKSCLKLNLNGWMVRITSIFFRNTLKIHHVYLVAVKARDTEITAAPTYCHKLQWQGCYVRVSLCHNTEIKCTYVLNNWRKHN